MEDKLEKLIAEMMHQQQLPGFAIGISQDGQTIYKKGFGTTNLHNESPVTPESVFQLCSLAKAFVATAIMQLVRAGKIDLDSPVTNYLPYFQINDERVSQIRLRHMLTHTSGLPGLDLKERFQSLRETPSVYDHEALERYVRNLTQVSLMTDPGETFSYSDMAYNILGEVIAKTSGQTFEDYTHDHIFRPLGMENSTFLVCDVNPDLLAMPHIRGETGEVIVSSVFPYTRHDAPSSNLYSNVDDMLRWASANLNRDVLDGAKILTASDHSALWTPYVETGWSDRASAYGFGWFLGTEGEHQIVRHLGGDLGYHAELLLVPDAALAIVAMGNYLIEEDHTWYASNVALSAMSMIVEERE